MNTDLTHEVLKLKKTDELLREMTPDRRALFERIINLRKRTGPVKFDVVQALREIREDG